MEKEELIKKLKMIFDLNGDVESAHAKADEALLEFINDKEVTETYDMIEKWYA